MATPSLAVVTVLLLLHLITSAAVGIGTTASIQEINLALEALRNNDYTLFANAIATSDLQYQLLPISSLFTLFAPKDDTLFALDIASDAALYVNTLRHHAVPNYRLNLADLQNYSSLILDTLLPHYAVYIENSVVGVMVDGIRISNPDLFLGSRIAVHGIDGILLSEMNVHRATVESPAPGPDSYNLSPPPRGSIG